MKPRLTSVVAGRPQADKMAVMIRRRVDLVWKLFVDKIPETLMIVAISLVAKVASMVRALLPYDPGNG